MNISADKSLAERLGAATLGVRKELEVTRQIFRGNVSYVIHDPVTFRSHEISAENYQIFAALDADVPLCDVFQILRNREILDEEQEEDFYQFVVQLNRLGLLRLPVSDGTTLYEKLCEKKRLKNAWRIERLLFFRVPLIQPDAFLNRTVRFAAPLFSRTAFLLWVIALSVCSILLVVRWNDFTDPFDSILSFQNLPVLWCLLIALKVVHEFGHAYACKRFGGQVPEMGAFFMLLTPCAYVDASACWSFPNRMHRLIVSIAGMYFESIVAMGALLYFFFSEPSQARVLAHYTFVLSTVVTLGFNINPLMRYDGYYIVADMVNIPNLRSQAQLQFTVYLKRLLFRIGLPDVGADRFGSIGLGVFGASSTAYRFLVISGIIVVIASGLPVLGLTIATLFFGSFVVRIAMSLFHYLRDSAEISHCRRRAVLTVGGLVAAVLALVTLIPIPHSQQIYGVVEGTNDRIVRAESSGFLRHAMIEEGQLVDAGVILAELENPELVSLVTQSEELTKSLKAQMMQLISTADPSGAIAAQQRLHQANDQLIQYRRLESGLSVTAPFAGRVVEASMIREPGRFVRKGDSIARISAGRKLFRTTLSEREFTDAAPNLGDSVLLRFAGTDRLKVRGRIKSISRSASNQMDDLRMTQLGGGDVAVDPETMQANNNRFELKIELTGRIPDQIRHGMSGAAKLRCPSRLLSLDLYRISLRFLHRLRLES